MTRPFTRKLAAASPFNPLTRGVGLSFNTRRITVSSPPFTSVASPTPLLPLPPASKLSIEVAGVSDRIEGAWLSPFCTTSATSRTSGSGRPAMSTSLPPLLLTGELGRDRLAAGEKDGEGGARVGEEGRFRDGSGDFKASSPPGLADGGDDVVSPGRGVDLPPVDARDSLGIG